MPSAPAIETERELPQTPVIIEDNDLELYMEHADEVLGIRLEMVEGLTVWEAHPNLRHQLALDRIRHDFQARPSPGSDCACIHVSDVTIRFPDGSLKRPDISVFYRMPDELDEAITLVPAAVVEILSRRYEKKDLEVGIPFYLRQSVKDVVVLDPRTGDVLHYRGTQEHRHKSPVTLSLECGCVVTV